MASNSPQEYKEPNMHAVIKAIEYHLPQRIETNEELTRQFPDWSVDKIFKKTGISSRHIAAENETSSDLAYAAALKLFESGACKPNDIDFVLFCTQSPDYPLPTTACILQHRLGIPKKAGALDFNLGCSGYLYGLGLAKGLIETGQAKNILFLTAETYSKYIDPNDRTVRTIFGDGGAATLIGVAKKHSIGPFVFGTDGAGAENLIVRRGALRAGKGPSALYMNGREIFVFTLKTIAPAVTRLLHESGKKVDDIDCYVFHQANAYMLESIRKKLEIQKERFLIDIENCGNTVSSTIPIALKNAQQTGQIKPGQLLMLVGFGVGYSWSAALVEWH